MDIECMCCLAIIEVEGSELCNRCTDSGCGPEEEMC